MSQSAGSLIAITGIVVASGSILGGLFLAARRGSHSPPVSSAPAASTTVHLYQRTNAPDGCRIGFITGDIMQARVADVWVNAENTDMEMARVTENSISGLIRYWGASRDSAGQVVAGADLIANDLATVVGDEHPVAPGTAFVTTSGELRNRNNVRHIVHVAAVQGEPGAGFRQVLNVSQCVSNALLACENLASLTPPSTSVLFPLLGAGNGRADVRETVETLLAAALNYLDAHPETLLRAVYFLGYTELEAKILGQIMGDHTVFTRSV